MKRALFLAAAIASLACSGPSQMDGGQGGGRAGGTGGTGGGTGTGGGSGTGGGMGSAGGRVQPSPDGGWCGLPGSWVRTDAGYHEVGLPDGGVFRLPDGGSASLTWVQLPEGFCVHTFANVGNVRQIRFAPGGELFAASPTRGTTSSGGGGRAAIVVMPDDDNDGYADNATNYRSALPDTQGIMFHDGGFWFQNFTRIFREPYAPGQRMPVSPPTEIVNIVVLMDQGHWPKTLDADDTGRVFVTNGSNQGETCDPTRPFTGGVVEIDGTDGGRQVCKGLRNAIYLRCHRDGNNRCFANELAKDYSAAQGGREKLIPIRYGDDWGYPCCAAQSLPYSDECLNCSALTETLGSSTATCMAGGKCSPRCTTTQPENASFIIGDTPFGLDFMDGQFPAPWDHRVYVAVHGAFGSWVGARVVGVKFDAATGLPLPGTNLPGADAGAMVDFLKGWDDGLRLHGRPADVTVSTDGRLFVANDTTGEIFWVAVIGR